MPTIARAITELARAVTDLAKQQGRASTALADVAREPLIQLNVDEMGHNAQRMWTGAGLQPRVTLRTASTEAVRSLVAAGLGVSIQPDMTYRPWSLEGDIIEARPIADLSQTLDVGLAWRRGSRQRPSTKRGVRISTMTTKLLATLLKASPWRAKIEMKLA